MKSGKLFMTGWKNGSRLEGKDRYFTITLRKEGHDPFIDYLKGVCIFFVVLTHCLLNQEYILFSLWGAQAVPLFLLIQTFHTYKNGIDKAVQMPHFVKLFSRIFKPFIVLQFFELFLMIVVFKHNPYSVIKEAVIFGGIGPGSYYVWIYVQFVFILPVIALIIKRLKKSFLREGGICLLMISLSCLLEMACVYTHIPEWIYRLLFFRYFFLIYLGYLWVEKGVNLNSTTLLFSIISIAFILLFSYTSINLEPLFFNTAWKIYHWICYFYVTYLFMFFLKVCYIHLNEKFSSFICLMGKYSYEIFLLQMFVFAFFPNNRLLVIVGDKYVCVALTVILTVSLSILPILGWKRWRKK